tara:strand:- start:899 stop:2344 length:1446 start_codon:yes stop_codon:yes gene_type:complete
MSDKFVSQYKRLNLSASSFAEDSSTSGNFNFFAEIESEGVTPNRTFTVKIYEGKPGGVGTLVAERDSETGALTLNQSGKDLVKTKSEGGTLSAPISEASFAQRLGDKFKFLGNVNKKDYQGKSFRDIFGKLNTLEKAKIKRASGNNLNADEDEAIDNELGVKIGRVEEGIDLINELEIKGRNARLVYGDYKYPEDLGNSENKQDRIKFTMQYSEGTTINASLLGNQKIFKRKIKSVRGSVTLPITTNIQDTNSVDWKGRELDPIRSLGAGAAVDLFEQARTTGLPGAVSSAVNTTEQVLQALRGDVGDSVAKAVNVAIAQRAVGAQNLLSRATGTILNPNLELLFNSPELRQFQFAFLMSPRDISEANEIRKIIRFFKQGMSVKTANSNVFLKAPNIFKIQYLTKTDDGRLAQHPSINRIKECALVSCSVNYTPAGSYMTYDDPRRSMTAYQLQLQFSELDPIYDSDYKEIDNNTNNEIGF